MGTRTNNTGERAAQTLAAAAPKPAVTFTSPESRDQILKPVKKGYDDEVMEVRKQDRTAAAKRAAKEKIGEQIRTLQQRYEQAEYEEKQAERAAALSRVVVQDTAAYLAAAGMEVAATVDPLAYPLEGSPLAVLEHEAMYNGSFPETRPHGFCIHCGQPAWQVPVSDASPMGARHSYGATCNPEDPNSPVATLALAGSEAVG
ncbi:MULTISPECIES: hypothetical protein [Streptosporangiaceae]|uniref:hypothetical protein n=1 Tax=Streptosporangiaceae TaxID=2004 RepID=UPI0033CC0CEE